MPRLPLHILLLTTLAMLAFAGNSLLCRVALRETAIDAASFTALRLLSGALMLWLLVWLRRKPPAGRGSYRSAFALFVYAAGFSYAYLGLTAATGALLLFGAVQVTMLSVCLWRGDRFNVRQLLGFTLAAGGLVGLLLPGLSAPPLTAAGLMLLAGAAWGVYSLRGKGASDPLQVTAGNFLRSLPFAAVLLLLVWPAAQPDPDGVVFAVASGALASGIGYAIWYKVLPALLATTAATVQLSVPVIAAVGGIVLLGEPLSLRLLLASVVILGGIALVVVRRT